MRASHTDIAYSVVVLIRMRNAFSASNSVAYVIAVLMFDTFSANVANVVTLYVDMRIYAKFAILSVTYSVIVGIDMDYALSASELIADVIVVCVDV